MLANAKHFLNFIYVSVPNEHRGPTVGITGPTTTAAFLIPDVYQPE